MSQLYPWYTFPFKYLNVIQVPWRLNIFVTFFFSIAGSIYITNLLQTKRQRLAGISFILIISCIMMISNGKNFQNITNKLNIYEPAVAGNHYHLIGLEYLPAKVPTKQPFFYVEKRGLLVETTKEDTKITNLKQQTGITSFELSLSSPETLELPLIYYKGYKATINGEEIKVNQSANGLIELNIDDSGKIEVGYGVTTIQKISFYITIISSLLFVIYLFYLFSISKRMRNKDSNL